MSWKAALASGLVILSAACAREEKQAAPEEPTRAEAGVVSEIVGVATISSADTIRVGPRRIRLDGIEPPRERAMCGDVNAQRAAMDALRTAVRSYEVRCSISDLPDAQGRDMAICRVNGADLNASMVSDGWARDRPADSNGAYADEEAAARQARRGVWGMECAADPWPPR